MTEPVRVTFTCSQRGVSLTLPLSQLAVFLETRAQQALQALSVPLSDGLTGYLQRLCRHDEKELGPLIVSLSNIVVPVEVVDDELRLAATVDDELTQCCQDYYNGPWVDVNCPIIRFQAELVPGSTTTVCMPMRDLQGVYPASWGEVTMRLIGADSGVNLFYTGPNPHHNPNDYRFLPPDDWRNIAITLPTVPQLTVSSGVVRSLVELFNTLPRPDLHVVWPLSVHAAEVNGRQVFFACTESTRQELGESLQQLAGWTVLSIPQGSSHKEFLQLLRNAYDKTKDPSLEEVQSLYLFINACLTLKQEVQDDTTSFQTAFTHVSSLIQSLLQG